MIINPDIQYNRITNSIVQWEVCGGLGVNPSDILLERYRHHLHAGKRMSQPQ